MRKRRMDSGTSECPVKVLQESRALQRAKIERLTGHACEGCRPNGTGTPVPLHSGAIAMLGEKCPDELEPSSQIVPHATLASIEPSGF
jgi:hypothetical protein